MFIIEGYKFYDLCLPFTHKKELFISKGSRNNRICFIIIVCNNIIRHYYVTIFFIKISYDFFTDYKLYKEVSNLINGYDFACNLCKEFT